ncbi:MAG TPA: LacI family DNA-binding transcriptional regulator [Candidatus Sulfomarinibacteraceae bacterium]|nr:LacI family DNA-binding transcriptional regulator [Candidatus Sulfomarinibacteraceae bacterium]
MSTISDVAQRAGVSAMTVSRVVNHSGYVSATTRQRVERAIAEFGYVPNALARQLRSKRTKTVALVVSDITNPFFTTIARGVEDAAAPRGFSVMYCNTDESTEEETQYLHMLIERQVDGVLLVPTRSSGASFRTLRAHRMPVVVLDRRVTVRNVDSVRCDSEAGAYALTRHLLSLGHRRIAVLTGRRTISTSVDRVAGCRRALEENGLELDDDLVRYGGYNFGSFNQADGRQMAQAVLASVAPRPTAIFAANNFIAFGAIRALREAGLRVPEDMSVVAFDDLPADWAMDPFLTVAAQPAYDIGRHAAELLLDRIAGDPAARGRALVLPFQLVIRRSSAAPPSEALVHGPGRGRPAATSRPVIPRTPAGTRRPARPAIRGAKPC